MKSTIKSAKTIEEAIELGLQELGLDRSQVEVEIIAEPTKGLFGIFGGNDATVKIKKKEKLKIDIEEIFSKDDLKLNYTKNDEKIIENIEVEQIEVIADNEIDSKENILEEEKEVLEETDKDNKDNKDELEEKNEIKEYQSYESAEEGVVNTKYLEFTGNPKIITDEDDLKTASEKTKKNLEDILVKMHIDAKVSYKTERDNIINLELSDISENDTGIVIGSKGETLNALQYIVNLLTNKHTKNFYRVTINVANYRDRRKKAIEQNAQKIAFRVLKTKRSFALKPMNSYERRIVHYALQNFKGIETVSSGKFPNRKVVIKYVGQ